MSQKSVCTLLVQSFVITGAGNARSNYSDSKRVTWSSLIQKVRLSTTSRGWDHPDRVEGVRETKIAMFHTRRPMEKSISVESDWK